MKIVAGLGSLEEYEPFVNAGADEFFAGYVPAWWNEKYGSDAPLNRREARFVNVQLGAREDLLILRKMISARGVPVKLTFNSLCYGERQYAEIAGIIKDCLQIGFSDFIIADPALLLYLQREGVKCNIHLSGELGEINSLILRELADCGMKRVIFHRKNTLEDMASCIAKCRDFLLEYEAFLLNEKCHYTGGFCNSLHCDEMCHLCHIPYRLGKVSEESPTVEIPENPVVRTAEEYIPGETGCGLCALWDLREAGVTHLKIVGRGNYPEDMCRDIAAAKQAIEILEESTSKASYIQKMKTCVFPDGCSGNCYYL